MAIQAKVGDVIHARGTLTAVGGMFSSVEFNVPGGASLNVRNDDIVHVEPQPLKVGDRVRSKDGSSICGPIIAIDKAHAWVKPVSAGFGFIVELDRLDRADGPRPMKVGDKVRWLAFRTIGTIQAIEKEIYHVKLVDGLTTPSSIRAEVHELELVE